MERTTDERWLESLDSMLGSVSPTGLALFAAADGDDELAWLDTPPERAAQARTAALGDGGGWLLRLPNAQREQSALFIGQATRQSATDPVLVMALALCRAAWRARAATLPPNAIVRDEVAEAIHALRNGLNSVIMSSAVLSASPMPPSLQSFVTDLENAGRRSLRALTELSALIATRPAT